MHYNICRSNIYDNNSTKKGKEKEKSCYILPELSDYWSEEDCVKDAHCNF